MDETTSNERLALVKPYTQRSFVHNQKENRSLDTVSSIEAIALDVVNSSGQFAAATLPRSVGPFRRPRQGRRNSPSPLAFFETHAIGDAHNRHRDARNAGNEGAEHRQRIGKQRRRR